MSQFPALIAPLEVTVPALSVLATVMVPATLRFADADPVPTETLPGKNTLDVRFLAPSVSPIVKR